MRPTKQITHALNTLLAADAKGIFRGDTRWKLAAQALAFCLGKSTEAEDFARWIGALDRSLIKIKPPLKRDLLREAMRRDEQWMRGHPLPQCKPKTSPRGRGRCRRINHKTHGGKV